VFVFAPFLQRTLQPAVIEAFGPVPVLSSLFAGPPYGIGILTAGLILAIMVLPFVTSISRDVFDTVPPVLKEAAYGVGCPTWEVFRHIVLAQRQRQGLAPLPPRSRRLRRRLPRKPHRRRIPSPDCPGRSTRRCERRVDGMAE
jgi:ABC-type amino acid transport system permease subunit